MVKDMHFFFFFCCCARQTGQTWNDMQIYLLLVLVKNSQADLNTRHCLHETSERWFSGNACFCTCLQVRENNKFPWKAVITRVEIIWPVFNFPVATTSCTTSALNRPVLRKYPVWPHCDLQSSPIKMSWGIRKQFPVWFHYHSKSWGTVSTATAMQAVPICTAGREG